MTAEAALPRPGVAGRGGIPEQASVLGQTDACLCRDGGEVRRPGSDESTVLLQTEVVHDPADDVAQLACFVAHLFSPDPVVRTRLFVGFRPTKQDI